MKMESADTAAGAEVRTLIETWMAAVRDRDLERIMVAYAPDVVAYDAIVALRFVGSDAYRDHWRVCLTHCAGGPMIFEPEELHVTVSGDAAFAHGLIHCGGTGDNGETHSAWMRMTACYRRTGNGWKIVHEHFSAPFEMESGKALFELEP